MAEEYFNLLKQNEEFMDSMSQMMSGEGGSDGDKTVEGGGIKIKLDAGAGKCGGCATGEGDEESVPGMDGSPTTGVTAQEVKVIKDTVAKDIISQKGRGNCPSGMVRWAEEQLKSTVPWRTLLQGCVRGMIGDVAGMVNYSYQRPARRQSVFGRIIMPSLRAPKPVIAMAIDTSGSMSAKDLGIAIAEVDGVLRSLGVDVTVISNDAEVGAVKKVRSKSQIELVGGGGTNMGPAIVKSAELKPTPNFLIIISDCDAAWGDFVPRFPIIVVKVGTSSNQPPDWIRKVIQVDTN